ncbi:formimidoylglutamase [Flavobacterium sp. RHBU_24]|uniref:formimidoylglutamase n=1 Tax=Flavobacterium sp. RHBU_24 TaxID=3391185 RepID=UPI0039855629
MKNIVPFTAADLLKYTRQRSGEIKFGERILTVPKDTDAFEFLKETEAQFVLLGIPEDIGIRANYGKGGASLAWHYALRSICNLQHNRFCKGSSVVILGHINVAAAMEKANMLDAKSGNGRRELSTLVEEIDKDVSHVVCRIIQAGKTPVVIGGGHNNAYGTIKGTALAKVKPVNAVNYDSRARMRMLEGRHSGNGFHYAFEEGFLKNYFIFGLHESYANKGIMENIKKNAERIRYNTYEQIAVRREKHFTEEMALAKGFVADEPFGIEIDLSALPHIPSDTMTASGFSVEKARHFVHYFGLCKNAAYLHICEGAPELDYQNYIHLTGKLIAALVSDFIKARTLKP